MNGYDVNQWNSAVGKAKDLGLTLGISAPNFRLYRSESQLGMFETIDQLAYFLDGYDWGRELLSRKEEQKEQKAPGPFEDPKYLYWFAGHPLPASLPPGCEWYNRHKMDWHTEELPPSRSGWHSVQRRWPKPAAAAAAAAAAAVVVPAVKAKAKSKPRKQRSK